MDLCIYGVVYARSCICAVLYSCGVVYVWHIAGVELLSCGVVELLSCGVVE